MNRGWANVLVTALVAALFGFGGAGLAVTVFRPPPPLAQVGVRQAVDDLLEHEIRLTAAQKAALQAIDERYSKQDNQVWGDIRMENAELSDALATNMTMNDDVKGAVARLQDSIGRFQTQTIAYVLEVRTILTPQQRLTYDTRVQKALARGPQ